MTIVKPYLSPQDLLTVDDTGKIEGLAIDYSHQKVLKLVEMIEYNLNKMLVDNGWAKLNPISARVEKLDL